MHATGRDEGEQTSKAPHHSVRSAFFTSEGRDMNPAERTRTSQHPTWAATRTTASSSVTLTACTSVRVLDGDRLLCVSSSLAVSRPSRMILAAPAWLNDCAVARPIPLP